MKHFAAVLLLLFPVFHISAQPWMPDNNSGRIKLQDIIDKYRYENPSEDTLKSGEEDRDFQFYRWVWYWQRHCDENGYLVPTGKSWNSWQTYKQQTGNLTKMERTTGADPANWTCQGTEAQTYALLDMGRINMIAFDPVDTSTLWLATPGGGAWKSTDGGANWKCKTDNIATVGISDITLNPKNHNTIYLCTGDRDGGNFFSIGVLKSTDGGNTWNSTGLKWNDTDFALTNSLTINRLDTNTIIVATRYGMYQSYDGGTTWTMTLPGVFKQVQYNASDTNIVYAASQYLFRSSNGGKTWDTVKSIPKYNTVRFTASSVYPDVIKVVTALSSGLGGIFTSSDAGKTFKETYNGSCSTNLLGYSLTSCGGQTNYDLAIAMNPLDTNKVYVGGIYGWYSLDGGYNWSQLNEKVIYPGGTSGMHLDIHCFAFHPSVANRLFECNDGGLYVGADPATGTSWRDINNGLAIKQYYKIAVNSAVPYIIGGAQDDGSTKILDSATTALNAYGDGTQCQLDGVDTTTYYTSQNYGNIFLCSTHMLYTGTEISANIPGRPAGLWITPFSLEPHCHKCIVAGYDKLYRSADQGSTWSGISPSGSALISYIGLTPADSKTIYYARNNVNAINYTHDGGATWATIIPPYSGYISNLAVDGKNNDHFWLTYGNGNVNVSGTSVAEYSPATGWHDIGAGIPPSIATTCLVQDSMSGDLYVGADYGVFYRTLSMTKWELFSKGLVTAGINDLGINYTKGEIWAATFGRGIWKSPLHSSTGISIIPFSPNALEVYPNPSHGSYMIRTGSLFANKEAIITLTDNMGKTVWKGNAVFDNTGVAKIVTNGLATGVYLMQAMADQYIIGRQKVMFY